MASPELDHVARWRRRQLFAAGLGLALLGGGCASAARADGRLVQVDIVDRDSGLPLHVYRDHGRPVVAGRPGARYAVRVVNRTGERVLAVVAIDGVNILTGETAAGGQAGYVLEPGERTSLTGWRKSHSEVAAFEFTALADSYAARTGRPDDVGVIGVAVFRERSPAVAGPVGAVAPLRDEDAAPARADRPAPPSAEARPAAPTGADTAARAKSGAAGDDRLAAMTPRPGERLGTGHGARESSVVVDTTFDRSSSDPQEILRIRYDSLRNLMAAGIAPGPVAQALPGSPRAFPGDPEPGFVPDPR